MEISVIIQTFAAKNNERLCWRHHRNHHGFSIHFKTQRQYQAIIDQIEDITSET